MSKQLNFTEDGYLTPIDGIETDLATFKKTFVDDFPFSEQRQFLFHNYQEYLRLFSRKITPQFEQ